MLYSLAINLINEYPFQITLNQPQKDMTPELYVTYVLACTTLVLIPGPIVSIVIGNSIAYGTKSGFLTSLGATMGTAVLLSIGATGISWTFDFLSNWHNWICWMGSSYLVFIGFNHWKAKPFDLSVIKVKINNKKILFLRGFIVAVTNPKTILFYAAFFPQFLDPTKSTDTQLITMCATFIFIALVIDGGYAILAGRIRSFFLNKKYKRIQNKIAGLILIFTGLGLSSINS